jgi:Zn-dependent protease
MLQVFRVAGIPVRIDASWLVIFALISWSLASGYFPHVLPNLSTGAAWVHAVTAAVLLFLSVFLHELSHALVAVQQGVRVSGIRLHVFGGVSELESEPATPRAEFLIAVVGPLTSFVIAALCYGLGRALADVSWLTALTGYLAVVNLVVALFNLVPGFPLDGGRLLRAMLWWWSGRLGWATRWASRAGLAFAVGLIALGALRALTGELVGGLWFVLIGLFLQQAARSGDDMAHVHEGLARLRVIDVMTPRSATVDPATPLSAMASAEASGHAALPVVRDERLIGFLPWRRLAERNGNGGTVADAMVPIGPEDIVAPEASAWMAFLKTGRNRAGRVAVVDGGRLLGTVTHRDLRHAAAIERLRAVGGRRAA